MGTLALIYAGKRMNGPKVVYAYAEPDTEDLRYYAKPLMAGLGIGVLVEFKADELGRIVTGSGIVQYQIDDADKVLAWSTDDKVITIRQARDAANRKRAKQAVDPLADAIDTLAKAYAGIRRYDIGARSAFIDYVTTSIQSKG